MKHIVHVAVAFVFALLLHESATAQWVSTTGIQGGQINSLEVMGSLTFAGTWGGGVYKSTDQGAHWTYSGLIAQKVRSMAAQSTNLFAGTHTGVWLSTDSGVSWASVNDANQINQYVYAMAASGAYIIAGGYGGITRSSDNGTTWTIDTTGLTSPSLPVADVRALAGPSGDLFCGIPSFGVALSVNNGATWNLTATQPGDLSIQALAYESGTVWAGTQTGVWVSTNLGSTWSTFSTGLTNPNVLSLTFQGTNIIAGTSGGGAFVSPVASAAWSAINSGLADPTVLALIVNGNLLAGTNGGVFSSTTPTSTSSSWTVANTGLTATRIYAMAVNGTTLFAGAYGSGLFRSTDDGTTWTKTTVANNYIHSMLVNGSAIYAGSEDGLYHSTDNGVTWNVAVTGLGTADLRDVRSILFHGSTLYAGTLAAGVYISTDGGANWTQTAGTGLSNTDVWGLAYVGSTLFAGTQGSGIFASTDNGSTWTLKSTGITGSEAFVTNTMASTGTTIYAGTGTGLWVSTNSGANWYDSTGTLGSNYIFSIIPNGTDLIVGVRNGGGVFLSPNSVASRDTNVGTNAGLTSDWVSSMAINTTELYAGISGAGVWKRPLSSPLPIQLATFNAATLSKTSVKLNWETLSEINNYGFQVQRSPGNSGAFVSIPGAFIAGNGTTTVKHDYSYVDNAYVTGDVYRLEQLDLTGTAHYTDAVDPLGVTSVATSSLPKEFSLSQNYPNPFNPSTVIEFALPKDTHVKLDVYNMIGQRVMTLVDALTPAGYHSVKVDGTNLASGMYLYRLTTGQQTFIKKLLLVK